MPREEREPEMLDAAADVFGRQGYNDASMDEIASAAGITKPMLYSYFGSKEGLFAACASRVGEQLRETVAEAAADEELPADERLWHGLLAVFGFIEEHRELWSMLEAPSSSPMPEAMREGAAEGRHAVSELLADVLVAAGKDEGIGPVAAEQAAPLAYGLTAAVIGVASWWLQHPEEPKELQALRVMNLTWMGFGDFLEGKMWMPPE